MKLRKIGRWALWAAAGLVAVVLSIYLLRWPLLEGRIRREVARLAGEHLRADVSIGRLEGDLLTSIRAEGLELRPRADSPVRSGRVRSVSVRYGFLGKGPIEIDAIGVDVSLASRPGSSSAPQTIREIIPVLRSIRFDGTIRARDVRLEFADRRRFDVAEAVLSGGDWSVRFRTDGFGEVAASARGGPNGALSIDALASEGPVRSAKVVLGPLEGREQALRVEGTAAGREILWEGRMTCDASGLPERAAGELKVPQGHARTEIDLVSEHGRLDIDGTIPLDEPVRADVELTLLAEGPLEGPVEAWSFSNVSAKTRNAVHRALKIDFAEASCPRGTLARMPIRAGFSAGRDHADVEGVVHWDGALAFELSGRAEAADVSRYLSLLPDPPSVKAENVRVEGKIALGPRGFSFDGKARCGRGSFDGASWQSLDVSGSYSPDAIEAREVIARGTPWAAVVTVRGKVQGDQVELRAESGPDRVSAKGRVTKSGDFDGDFSLEGPCLWLRSFNVQLPEWAVPLEISGKAARSGKKTEASVTLRAGKGIFTLADVTALQKDDSWTIDVKPGALELPERRRVSHEHLVLDVRPGRASLSDLKLVLNDPAVTARIDGAVEWTAEETKLRLTARALEAWGVQLEALQGLVTVDRRKGESAVEVRWGREGGSLFEATGRLGPENDFHVVAKAPDLRDPFVRKLLGNLPVEGSAAADLHVYGRLDRPETMGTIALRGVTAPKVQAVNLVVEVRTEEDYSLRLRAEEATPYGKLSLEGRVGLPWIEDKARVDLRATLDAEGFGSLREEIPADTRKWIPTGSIHVEAYARGPVATLSEVAWGVRLSFETGLFQPPKPLGLATNLRVSARLDAGGLLVESVEGRLGKGSFEGKGLWELWKEKEGRPLALHVTGDDLLVVDDPLARIRIKPDATLHWTSARGLWLDGYVEVPLGFYHRELGSPAIGSSAGRAAPPLEAMVPRLRLIPLPAGGFRIPGIVGLEELALDLRIRTTGEFRIENGAVGVLIGAEGQIRGTGAEPALSGWVRTKPRQGEIRLGPGAFIRMDSAELVLPADPGKEANVRFEGHLGAGQDQITILVIGPPDRASLTLLSEPPKSQKELLAIIGQKVAFGTLAGTLTPGLSDEWPMADRKESFFERILPTVIPGEAPGQRREPWELPAEGTARGTVVRTEYILNRWFSIVAETDRQADVSGDVKLRIRF